MESLSRNKKIAILSLVVLSLTLIGFFGTGKMSFSWLKSDILNQSEYVCTEKGQITNKGAYTRALKSRDNTNNLITLRQSEITVLENKITTNQTLIVQKKSQIETKKSTIKDLQTSINKNCVGNLKPNAQKICNQKKQQLQKAQSDLASLNKEVSRLESEIKKFEQQIATKKQNINVLEAKREANILFITQYELCDRQLKVKPLLTSPQMSGEARMSGELLVSGEICMSSEVLISGEVHVSGEVNAPVYRLAVNEEYPGKAQIESIDYTIAPINVNTIQIIDWFVAEEYTSNILSKCSFQDANKTQLHCIFDTKTVVVQSETRNYILYAQVKAITGPGSFKVYSANITYNGGKVDAVNRTMTVEIKYGEKRECHNEKPSITVISPNGGETLRLSDSITTRWITPESQKYNPVQIYFVPQDNTPKNPLNPIGYTIGGVSPSRSNPLSNLSQTSIGMPNSLGIPEGTYKMKIFMFSEGTDLASYIFGTRNPIIDAIASDESDNSFKVLTGKICPEYSAPICRQGEILIPGKKDVDGCSLPPTCQADTILPVITSLTLPITSSTTRVPLIIHANKTPVSYLMIDGPTPKDGLVPALPPKPAVNDVRWLSSVPTSYNFSGIGSRTFFAWVKDEAGNVSDYRGATVIINQCPEIMPPVCEEGQVLVPQTGTGANGCSLPPICSAPTDVCPIYSPLPEDWCQGTILTFPKDSKGCDLPPICLL